MGGPACPKCQSPDVLAGDCVAQSPVRGFSLTRTGILSWFVPARARFLRWSIGITFTRRFAACLSCGHVWGAVDPARLRSFVASYCTEVVPPDDDELAGRLAALEAEAMKHLPDTPTGRQIATILAALDRLASGGRTADLPRHYRAMTGATWEVAARVTHDWQYRTLGEKLQRLGWSPQSKKRVDDLADPLT